MKVGVKLGDVEGVTYEDGVFVIDDPVKIVAVGDGVGEFVRLEVSDPDDDALSP